MFGRRGGSVDGGHTVNATAQIPRSAQPGRIFEPTRSPNLIGDSARCSVLASASTEPLAGHHPHHHHHRGRPCCSSAYTRNKRSEDVKKGQGRGGWLSPRWSSRGTYFLSTPIFSSIQLALHHCSSCEASRRSTSFAVGIRC